MYCRSISGRKYFHSFGETIMAVTSKPPAGNEQPFKVIIVGAGVAGLVLAHSLELAKIDYVLLDKGIVAPPWGTSITIHPHGCRILHQIQSLDAVSDQCAPMELFHQRDSSGKSFLKDSFFDAIAAR